MKSGNKLILPAGTVDANKNEWLRVKANHISGTDAGIIMGVSPWETPLSLYLKKRGNYVPRVPRGGVPGLDPMKWGTLIEPLIADEFTAETGIKVTKRGTVQDGAAPYRIANIDRKCIGIPAGLECKTTSEYNAAAWDGDSIPRHYYWQCIHYMMVMFGDAAGRLIVPGAHWYIAVLIGGQRFKWKKIEYNEPDAMKLASAEEAFWKAVQNGTPPPVTDSPLDEYELLNQPRGKGSEYRPELEGLGCEICTKERQAKELKKEIQFLRNQLAEKMAGVSSIHGDIFSARVYELPGRSSINLKELKEKAPDLFDEINARGLVKVSAPVRKMKVR